MIFQIVRGEPRHEARVELLEVAMTIKTSPCASIVKPRLSKSAVDQIAGFVERCSFAASSSSENRTAIPANRGSSR